MTPEQLSASLRAFAEKVDRSESPSRSSVASGLRDLLAAVSAGPTKVVVSDYWSREDADAVAADLGGTDMREGPYGDIGMVLPLDSVAKLKADAGEDVMVFDSWEEASGEDRDYEFTPVDISSAPSAAPSA